MSNHAPDTRRYPGFTIGDRLRKARTLLGPDMDVKQFAQVIGVNRNTIANYELERTAPENMKPIVLRQWAMATGVDYEWLRTGEAPAHPSPEGSPVTARLRRFRYPRKARAAITYMGDRTANRERDMVAA